MHCLPISLPFSLPTACTTLPLVSLLLLLSLCYDRGGGAMCALSLACADGSVRKTSTASEARGKRTRSATCVSRVYAIRILSPSLSFCFCVGTVVCVCVCAWYIERPIRNGGNIRKPRLQFFGSISV